MGVPRVRSTGVVVLDRAAAILDAVESEPMRANELARRLGLSVPTTHRLMAAMVGHELLRRDADGRHHIGRRFLSSGLAAAAGSVVRELADATGESVQLWVLRGERRLCLVSADSSAELRSSIPVGTLLPLSDPGSAADVLRAESPEPTDGPEPPWRESLRERSVGLCSVSAPVRAHGEVVAVVCLSAPAARVRPGGPGAQFGAKVAAAADRLAGLLQQ